jgi:hypothetical protein
MIPYAIDIFVIAELQGAILEMTIISRTDDKINTKRINPSKSGYTILTKFVKDTIKRSVYGGFSNTN